MAEALAATRTDALQERLLEELSGGQRQRVWIAMALAQQTEVLLLDEPTTFLDVTHQLEVLDVVRDLNRERGTTVGIVLHDLNLAARYADHLVAVRAGEIHSQGSPAEVITAQMAHEVFALDAHIAPDPVTGSPMVLPRGRDRSPSPHHHEEDPVSITTRSRAARPRWCPPSSTPARSPSSSPSPRAARSARPWCASPSPAPTSSTSAPTPTRWTCG